MTTFEYAVFVSYRNSHQRDNGLLSTFARELAYALERVIDPYLYEEIGQKNNTKLVFLDETVIKDGDWIVKEVSEGICQSVCWLLIYSRNYFGGSLFCASELKGMVEIQQHRKHCMGKDLDKSLIIPLLFRGDFDEMPPPLKNIAYKSDFRRFTLAVKNIAEHPDFAEQIENLAELIAQRQKEQCDKSQEVKVDLCGNHPQFKIEDVNTAAGKQNVEAFIQKLKSPDFPVI